MKEDLLARLLDKVENRYYGKYRGIVVSNQDPEHRGRLQLQIPSVLGDVVSGWALPCVPYGGAADQGFFFIPEKGASVWVEFEAGNIDYPIWVGTFWGGTGASTEVPQPGDSQAQPASKIIKTLKHTIELADEEGEEAIKITDAHGNAITMEGGGVTIKSDKIKIGEGANEQIVLGTTLLIKLLTPWYQMLATHIHKGNLGFPTSPPDPPLVPPLLDLALSKKHFVE